MTTVKELNKAADRILNRRPRPTTDDISKVVELLEQNVGGLANTTACAAIHHVSGLMVGPCDRFAVNRAVTAIRDHAEGLDLLTRQQPDTSHLAPRKRGRLR